MAEYIKNENKEHLVDRWAKKHANNIWSKEKNQEDVVKIVQSKENVITKINHISDNIEKKYEGSFLKPDWIGIKKYVHKHIKKDLNF